MSYANNAHASGANSSGNAGLRWSSGGVGTRAGQTNRPMGSRVASISGRPAPRAVGEVDDARLLCRRLLDALLRRLAGERPPLSMLDARLRGSTDCVSDWTMVSAVLAASSCAPPSSSSPKMEGLSALMMAASSMPPAFLRRDSISAPSAGLDMPDKLRLLRPMGEATLAALGEGAARGPSRSRSTAG